MQNGAALLIDEVQTGGGTTGEFWCHDHFNLDQPVDIVTYSKKMLIGGYFSLPEFRLAYNQNNRRIPRLPFHAVVSNRFIMTKFNQNSI